MIKEPKESKDKESRKDKRKQNNKKVLAQFKLGHRVDSNEIIGNLVSVI